MTFHLKSKTVMLFHITTQELNIFGPCVYCELQTEYYGMMRKRHSHCALFVMKAIWRKCKEKDLHSSAFVCTSLYSCKTQDLIMIEVNSSLRWKTLLCGALSFSLTILIILKGNTNDGDFGQISSFENV
mmetsp:Transcript_26052/g.53328  ORF Transcript_26052/g.53328 Transcript_26052/m.53328 type:complete len:129 (-) Transcript_26052:976-1362(-)